ncbi:hypothetical protein CDD83_1437 [Cordyceps sp. RAO-2017]|nr:hypothetical protein CDD83_1437 [Cordyceps sp. RAO-2017]
METRRSQRFVGRWGPAALLHRSAAEPARRERPSNEQSPSSSPSSPPATNESCPPLFALHVLFFFEFDQPPLLSPWSSERERHEMEAEPQGQPGRATHAARAGSALEAPSHYAQIGLPPPPPPPPYLSLPKPFPCLAHPPVPMRARALRPTSHKESLITVRSATDSSQRVPDHCMEESGRLVHANKESRSSYTLSQPSQSQSSNGEAPTQSQSSHSKPRSSLDPHTPQSQSSLNPHSKPQSRLDPHTPQSQSSLNPHTPQPTQSQSSNREAPTQASPITKTLSITAPQPPPP